MWLNSISTRAPSLTSGRDIRKIFRKLASFLRGKKHIKDNLWVYTHIVLTLPHEITLAGPVRVRCLGRIQRNEEEKEEQEQAGVVARIERYEFMRADENVA